MILLDTNVLVHAVNVDSPEHRASRAVVDAAAAGDLALVLVPQVLLETYAVLTDERRVTQPLQPDQAWAVVDALRGTLPVLDVPARTLDALGDLIGAHRAAGKDIFDVFLVAQMRVHGVASLCTYNASDFESFRGISAETPEALLRRQRLR